MHLRIEPHSGVPLGTQITRQIKLAIAKGRLEAGDRLPSARDLANDLQVNFHTVRKAYSQLERERLLDSARGRGTFVASEVPDFDARDLEQLVREHVERLLEDLAGTDVEYETLLAAIENEISSALKPSTSKQRRRTP
jgi:GntR family transcriptional regulator